MSEICHVKKPEQKIIMKKFCKNSVSVINRKKCDSDCPGFDIDYYMKNRKKREGTIEYDIDQTPCMELLALQKK